MQTGREIGVMLIGSTVAPWFVDSLLDFHRGASANGAWPAGNGWHGA